MGPSLKGKGRKQLNTNCVKEQDLPAKTRRGQVSLLSAGQMSGSGDSVGQNGGKFLWRPRADSVIVELLQRGQAH